MTRLHNLSRKVNAKKSTSKTLKSTQKQDDKNT